MPDNAWVAILLGGFGGLGLGIGLVVGALIARWLRRYVREDEVRPRPGTLGGSDGQDAPRDRHGDPRP